MSAYFPATSAGENASTKRSRNELDLTSANEGKDIKEEVGATVQKLVRVDDKYSLRLMLGSDE